MGVVLTGLCVGVRKDFVTMTVFPCVGKRHLLFPFRTEDGKLTETWLLRPYLETLFFCSLKWPSKGIQVIRKTKLHLPLDGNACSQVSQPALPDLHLASHLYFLFRDGRVKPDGSSF